MSPFLRAFPLQVLLPLFAIVAVSFAQPSDQAAAPDKYTFKKGVNISHWLSQNFETRPYAAPWFDEEDISWIAQHGFDHIRLPVDGRIWLRADGSLDDAKIKPFEQALAWAHQHRLGTVLDMHFLPGASFDPGSEETSAFTDETVQTKVADFWRKVASRFSKEGAYLRFEILNEPVAKENQQLNPFNARMLATIRESNPTRIVYITSNRYGQFTTVSDLVVPKDPNIAITLHYYEPMVFTHQRASWVKLPADMPEVRFPGKVPDLKAILPADHFLANMGGKVLSTAEIDENFDRAAAWLATHAAGKEVYIGEFGAYDAAPSDSRRAYVAAVARNAERQGWGWSVWDYQGGFAVRDGEGKPTAILEGLFPR